MDIGGKKASRRSRGMSNPCLESIQTRRASPSCSTYATCTASSILTIIRAMGRIVFFWPGIMMGVPSVSRFLRTRLSSRVAMSNAISSTYPKASIWLCFWRRICPSRYGLLRKPNLASTLDCCLYSPSMLLAGYLSSCVRLVVKTK